MYTITFFLLSLSPSTVMLPISCAKSGGPTNAPSAPREPTFPVKGVGACHVSPRRREGAFRPLCVTPMLFSFVALSRSGETLISSRPPLIASRPDVFLLRSASEDPYTQPFTCR